MNQYGGAPPWVSREPNRGWIGRNDPPAVQGARRTQLAADMARRLRVPVEEIALVERAEATGTTLTAYWLPS